MDRLNYFSPYQSKSDGHEDQLTRAFLVVLRNVPLVQAAFIETVRTKLGEHNHLLSSYLLGSDAIEKIETQVAQVPTDGVTDLVAIMMTDKNWKEELPVARRERGARYDGIVQLGSVVLTIENKPCSNNIWKEQVNPALAGDSDIKIHRQAVVLYWPDIISILSSFISRRLLDYCSTELVEDFLAFVHANFPLLNPYDKIHVCGESPELLHLRCKSIMETVAPRSIKYHHGAGHYIAVEGGPVRQIFLRFKPANKEIVLAMMPGDTIKQARELYETLNLGKLRALQNQGWRIRQNLHFSHIQRHYFWSNSEVGVDDYLAYWSEHRGRIKQENRDTSGRFNEYFSELLSLRLITDEDQAELDKLFNESGRNHIRPCPGIDMEFGWALQDAGDFDKKGSFHNLVKQKILEAFSAWSQAYIPLAEPPA